MRKRDTELAKTHRDYAKRLRAVASFIVKNAGKKSLVVSEYSLSGILETWAWSDAKERVKQLADDFGHVEKVYEGDYFSARVPVAPGINLQIKCSRGDVCKKVETGEVERKKVRKCIQEAVYEDVEEDVPVTAWDCGSLLKSDSE